MFKDKAYANRGVASGDTGVIGTNSQLGFKEGKKQEAHTAPTKYGMGDYYGTGYKNPIGKIRDQSVGYRPVTREQLGTPPRGVV